MATPTQKTDEDSGTLKLAKQLTAGTVAGIAQTIVGHPLDTIKVRLQTQNPANPQFNGIVDCVQKTMRAEGPKGFFKGMLSPLSGIALVNAIIFGSYSQAKGKFEARHEERKEELRYGLLPYHEVAIAGSFAGLTNSFVSGPVELLKTQMQVQYSNPDRTTHYSGSFDAASKITCSCGPISLSRGLFATLVREVPGTAGYYAAYELARRTLAGDSDPRKLGVGLLLTSGALAGIGYWLCCYPFDMIKSRIQSQPFGKPLKYHSWLHCAQTMIRTEGGFPALYRGFSAAILRTIPASGATFAAFELTMRALDKNPPL